MQSSPEEKAPDADNPISAVLRELTPVSTVLHDLDISRIQLRAHADNPALGEDKKAALRELGNRIEFAVKKFAIDTLKAFENE